MHAFIFRGVLEYMGDRVQGHAGCVCVCVGGGVMVWVRGAMLLNKSRGGSVGGIWKGDIRCGCAHWPEVCKWGLGVVGRTNRVGEGHGPDFSLLSNKFPTLDASRC